MSTLPRSVEVLKRGVSELLSQRFTVFRNFVNAADGMRIALDLEARYDSGRMKNAGVKGLVGRPNRHVNTNIRQTSTVWLNREGEGAEGGGHKKGGHTDMMDTSLHLFLETFREELAQELQLPLEPHDTELLYARYPVGGFYTRHSDSAYSGTPLRFARDTERRLSFILYLPKLEAGADALSYDPADGGRLRLFPGALGVHGALGELGEGGRSQLYKMETQRVEKEGEGEVDVDPTPNSLVIFLSQGLPHEVLPTNGIRRAVVGWFRVRSKTSTQ
jgi:Rps23 Pro-64 3,4-dihydroxylase Tpa1-like proline 4-hydroxylase